MSDGLELPNAPGIWVRGDDWIHVRSFELRLYWRLLFFENVPSTHDSSPTRAVDESMPHGNWFPAVSAAATAIDVEAVAKELLQGNLQSLRSNNVSLTRTEIAAILRKHFQPAANEGAETVMGIVESVCSELSEQRSQHVEQMDYTAAAACRDAEVLLRETFKQRTRQPDRHPQSWCVRNGDRLLIRDCGEIVYDGLESEAPEHVKALAAQFAVDPLDTRQPAATELDHAAKATSDSVDAPQAESGPEAEGDRSAKMWQVMREAKADWSTTGNPNWIPYDKLWEQKEQLRSELAEARAELQRLRGEG